MDNKTFLEYIHTMYGQSFSFEVSKKQDKGGEDESTVKTFKSLLEFDIYNMQEEFSYLKKFIIRHKAKISMELADPSLRRGIYLENPVLWKTIYFLGCLSMDRLRSDYIFLEPEIRSLARAYNRIDASTSLGRFAYLARSIGMIFRDAYKLVRFKVDKRIDETEFSFLGIKGNTIYLGFYTSFNESKEFDYIIETYKGSMKDKELKYLDKRPGNPGEIMLNDYNAINQILDVKGMDMWWTRN